MDSVSIDTFPGAEKLIEIEKSADEIDRASQIADAENEYRISVAMKAGRPLQVQNADGSWPIPECECGETIPLERLKLGRINCVYCQSELERRADAFKR